MIELKQLKSSTGVLGQVATVQADGSLSPGDFKGVNDQAACKGWVNFNGTGVVAIRDSFNVTSITDNGVGIYAINWGIDFDNTNYAVNITATAGVGFSNGTSNTVGSAQVESRDTAGTLTDSLYVNAQAFGDNINLSVGGSAPGVKVQSLCKGWIDFTSIGSTVINNSYNVASLTDLGAGATRIFWDIPFDNSNYAVAAISGQAETQESSRSASQFTLITNTSGGGQADSTANVIAFGDNPIALTSEAGFNFGDVSVLTPGATVTPAVVSNTNVYTLVAAQNFILNTPTGVPVGKSYKADLFVTQDATGSRVLTLAAGWKVESGTAPVLTTTVNAVDWLALTYDGANWYIGLAMGDAS